MTVKCSSCGAMKLLHVVAQFVNGNALPYCEDCWVVMFCSTITPRVHKKSENKGIAAAGKAEMEE